MERKRRGVDGGGFVLVAPSFFHTESNTASLMVVSDKSDPSFGGYTNRTAQGGGGSFKNRKTIGEVSCCDSWMAERTEGPKGG